MSRLSPLLFLALLPVAVAAPVPRGGRPDFGANGLLTRADLEKVRFDSRPIKERDKSTESTPEHDAKSFDVAVHMPWTTFRQGEPIPVYFVLRNKTNKLLGLTSRIDFSGSIPELHGSAATLSIRDCATGESVLGARRQMTHCSDSSLVDVPANGFYMVKADLSLASNALLPPGDYEVDWQYGPLCSAPVKFSVVKSDAKPVAITERPAVRFYHISEKSDHFRRLEKVVQEPFNWRETCLGEIRTESMAAALAVGQNGVYVPDVRTISAADKLVEAWLEWKPYRDGDRVVVTLRAVPWLKEVRFEDLPELYLQLEVPDGSHERGSREYEEAKLTDISQRSLVTPLTIEARLPKGWRERTGITGTARVAILVTSKRLEFPRGGERVQKAVEEIRKVDSASKRPPLWSGTLRTDFVELRFP